MKTSHWTIPFLGLVTFGSLLSIADSFVVVGTKDTAIRRSVGIPSDPPRTIQILSATANDENYNKKEDGSGSDDDEISLEAFQARKRRDEESKQYEETMAEFDGYAMRDAILEKWGMCYDVDFNRVDSFGFRQLYLNVLPFHLGGRRFRHETELDYLCHLQAVVEILQKYDQLGYVLYQIEETDKKPRAGTSPLVAVPLRLDLTREQVQEIIGY